jgi:hypothetical protein
MLELFAARTDMIHHARSPMRGHGMRRAAVEGDALTGSGVMQMEIAIIFRLDCPIIVIE